MRVVFLDIDGVLNQLESCFPQGQHAIEANLVARLNGLIERSGAALVISSDWRLFHGWPGCGEILRECGVVAEILGVTPQIEDERDEIGWHARGREVRAWLDEHPGVDSFVIVDDHEPFPGLEARFVQTDANWGLQPADVGRALAILARPVNPPR